MYSSKKDSNLDIHSLDFTNDQSYYLIISYKSVINFHINFKFTIVILRKFQALMFFIHESKIYWHCCALGYQVPIFIIDLLIY